MVDALGDEFEFQIITSDRDLGDERPFDAVTRDEWQQVEKARVWYLSGKRNRWVSVLRLLRCCNYDLIYVNSFWSRLFSMWPVFLWRLGLTRAVPLLIAPRGEFSPGALGIKPKRKQLFIGLARYLRLYQGAAWHVSTCFERAELQGALSRLAQQRNAIRDVRHGGAAIDSIRLDAPSSVYMASPVFVAFDLVSRQNSAGTLRQWAPKRPGSLKVIFVSRISRMKHLDGALRILAGIRGDIQFNIYGPIEDAGYWRECQRLIIGLPSNVRVAYQGELAHSRVGQAFREHHLFLFPTRGENFGHVIAEAMANGCPVLISDQTPWRELRKMGVGWDLPLKDIQPFREALEECVEMTEDQYHEFSARAATFSAPGAAEGDALEANASMLRELTRSSVPDLEPNSTSTG